MASELSRVSRNTWDHTITYWRELLLVSIVPFAMIVAVGTLYLASIDLSSLFVTPEEPQLNGGQLLGNILLSALDFVLWTWLAVKVLRFRLLDEPTTAIGASGTLRCTGKMLAFMLGAFGLALGAALGISVVALTIVYMAGSAVLYFFLLLLGLFAIVWGLSRLLVGFVPLAIGEEVGFFSGLALTRETHMALFTRVMITGAIIFFAVFAVIMVVLLIYGEDVSEFVTALEAGTAVPSLNLFIFLNFVSQIVTLLFYWYVVSLLAEAYLRLSDRTPPL